MNHFTQKLDEVVYHLENGNENLGFRMLVDAVLDTGKPGNFNQCIALAAWRETHPDDTNSFVNKAKELAYAIGNQQIQLQERNEVLIRAQQVSKSFGKSGFTLGPADIEISSGQLLGLVGENGNGKTTLLRMLSKELAVSSGTILFPFAKSGIDEYSLRSRLTYIPQRTPKWYGAVKDNLKFTATHYGIAPAENEQWVLMLMIRFGLWSLRNHKWNELSSGYKMRFELARTFLRKPKLLLLDEPLANLDILSQQLILEDLRLMGKSLANPLGIVLSSQQLYEVEKVSDEVIFLKNGKPSSFNKLKNTESAASQSLIVEIEIANSKEALMQALAAFEVTEVKFLGSNYFIEIRDISAETFLQSILSASIQIKYFRDISFSTRRFFNQ